MFDGVPHDQLHQFIVSSRSAPSSLPPPFSSFPHHQTSLISSSFDPFHPQSHPHHQPVLPLQQHHQQQPVHHFLHPIFHQSAPATNNSHKSCINEEKQAPNTLVSPAVNLPEIERERSVLPQVPDTDDHPWSNDEVLALLRIRSAMESWLPDFTWEHVSGKLSELGFKRSGEKCKEKFEEESRYFDNINNYTKSCRFLSELEELYHSEENPHQNHNNDNINSSRMNIGTQKSQIRVHEIVNPCGGGGGGDDDPLAGDSPTPRNDRDDTANGAKESERGFEVVEEKAEEKNDDRSGSSKKRKREKIKFEMFKGFCEEVVNKMMSQQEEMHNKLLENMVKRDKEKVEKEEAWKKQEMEKMNKELEIMAHEQAIAGGRQATIIEFLKKFISSSAATSTNTSISSDQSQFSAPPENRKDSLNKAAVVVKNTPNDTAESPNDAPNPNLHENQINNNVNIVEEVQPSSTLTTRHQNSTLSNHHQAQNPSGHDVVVSDIGVAPSTTLSSKNPNPASATANKVQNDFKDDVGKRWPRDEVLALINLRCNLYNSGESDKDRQGNSAAKAPLWERISQGMSELGYKRSAKRCKEKWENINKYFRKTKDVNKKRSVDSRTCPYFHRLSTLYSKGTLVAPPSEGQELFVVNHDDSSQLGSDLPPDHTDHRHGRNDKHDNHVAQAKRSDNNVVVHHHHQEVPAAFDFEF